MKNFTPRRPTGDDEEAAFFQWVYDEIIAGRLLSSATIKVNRTAKGTTAIINQPPPAVQDTDDGVWL